ncbi:hypothetical protein THASP1DRAFT_32297 [Thamnocephalis sphaerospora]|uniref:Anti-proliferative protein domain-containing protein n=1 Tax=Thamnocephalis sphaerospora TaxID=78915 RepID=A0A4P9XJD8_9FUNG|nr:hypothetical protein THASP1DRAFT_32297 [Thamnocephalis sphaerospora]|eukprot:RKP05872.1 hypothetical protein THASP1DRAFT_32297 [Thamnocephalis sphaerospora]
MLKEINVAAEFFARLFRLPASTQQHDRFVASLSAALRERCEGHWHPMLHSAHRAVTIFGGVPDQILLGALRAAGLDDNLEKVIEWVPKELVVWIDPSEVAFRIGDRGQPATLYKEHGNGGDSDSDSGFSDGSDAASRRTPSPTNGKRRGNSPPSRAVRITAPGSAPSIPAPVASQVKPAPLSPLGQAVMNAAARTQSSAYHGQVASAAPTVFASQNHYMQQQQQQQFFQQQLMQQQFRQQQQQQQQQQFYHSHHQQHYRRQQQQQQQQQQMMMNGMGGMHMSKPRANSPSKSVARYVEAR